MKLVNKFRIAMSALAVTTIASFAGALSGTIAWFAYSTRATVSYSGTSVNQSELLQIGLICESDYWPSDHQAMADDYGVTYEYVAGKHVYFAKPGSGLKSEAIQVYLDKTGYAIDQLQALTTKSFANTGSETFNLYQPLVASHPINNNLAYHNSYSKITFAFRILQSDSATPVYVKNQNVWITDATAQADGEGDIAKALRIYFDGSSSNGNRFILNPTSDETESDPRETAVGGLLNLDGDSYYDYDAFTGEEILYGEYDKDDSLVASLLAEDSELVDMNDSGVYSGEHTTFYAKHKGGKKVYNYTKDSFLEKLKPAVAKYDTFNTIKPEDNVGSLSGGKILCRTSDDSNALATLDMTIWIEGWDHAVIDDELNHKFNLGIQFQINKL